MNPNRQAHQHAGLSTLSQNNMYQYHPDRQYSKQLPPPLPPIMLLGHLPQPPQPQYSDHSSGQTAPQRGHHFIDELGLMFDPNPTSDINPSNGRLQSLSQNPHHSHHTQQNPGLHFDAPQVHRNTINNTGLLGNITNSPGLKHPGPSSENAAHNNTNNNETTFNTDENTRNPISTRQINFCVTGVGVPKISDQRDL
ncbi:hypothetical protein PSHT_11567 [Puccinia striiformis]|uniref:Uncharacterized protein n=1 Tax=Puccinia striiformis TaxID=27350 RepID=A0A2S4V2E5_9BASI|nr:hypothetical protein Pst134EB_031039 [Puccinia striiformis f. sp. tritici]POW03693.1 hypothetical protein PSHT_11567 [Puccinia striiformis]